MYECSMRRGSNDLRLNFWHERIARRLYSRMQPRQRLGALLMPTRASRRKVAVQLAMHIYCGN